MISWFSNLKKQPERTYSTNIPLPPSLPTKRIDQTITLILSHLDHLLSVQLQESQTTPSDFPSLLHSQLVEAFQQQLQQSTKYMQSSLLQTKQRYNLLVVSLDQTKQGMRDFHDKIGLSIEGLGNVIADVLKTKEMVIPIRQIKKALVENNGDSVEKYIGLLGKLIQHQYFRQKQQNKGHQVQITSKTVESQLMLIKEQKKHLQKRLTDMQQQRQTFTKQFQSKEIAILQKLKLTQQKLISVMTELKDSKRLCEQLKNEAKGMAELQQSSRITREMRQQKYLQSIKKLNQQKMEMEDRYSQLQIQINRIKNQQQQTVTRSIENVHLQLKQANNRISLLDHERNKLIVQINEMKDNRKSLVQKDLIKGMLEVYMDDGKEWAIKTQAQKQLFLLLDIKKEQNQQIGKKWFGWF